MSLYSVAQSSSTFRFANDLENTTNTVALKSGASCTVTTSGTLTQGSSSRSGTGSYAFSNNAYINHNVTGLSGQSFGISGFTLEAIFKRSGNPTSTETIFHFQGSSTSTYSDIRVNTSGQIAFQTRTSYGTASITSSTNFCDGKWHHVIASYDTATSGVKLYVDGNLIGTVNGIGNMSYGYYWTAGAYRSGGSTGTYSQYFNGSIDYVGFDGISFFSTGYSTWRDAHFAETSGTNQAASPMTGSASAPKVLAVHDVLSNLATQDGAVYKFKFNSNLNDIDAPSSHTFTNTNSGYSYVAGATPSITGGAWEATTSTPNITYTESGTPVFNNYRGTTLEFVFYIEAQVTSGTYKTLFLRQFTNGGTQFATVFLNQSGSDNVLGYQLNNTDYYTFNTPTLDNGWHHAIIEWGAKDDYITAYIDGSKYQSTSQYTYNQNHWDDNTSYQFGVENVWIDFFAVYSTEYNANSYLTDDDATIHYVSFSNGLYDMYNPIVFADTSTASGSAVQPTTSISYDPEQGVATASAEMVNPYAILITMNQSEPMTASATFPLPQGLGTVTYGPAAVTANATMVHPAVSAIRNVNYSSGALTASAQFETVFWSHDSGLDAPNLLAEAEMLEAVADIAGLEKANPMIALDCALIMPGIVTVLGAQVFAKPMESRATFVLPPAYFSLLDDPWYVRLYAQHAQQNIEPRFITSSLASESRTQVAKTILKFFDDVTEPITVGSARYLENDLENKVFLTPESTDTTKIKVYPTIAPNLTPTPILDRGYFDTFGRQAVRVQNIEFAMPEEIYNSKLPFSLEFSIKTTKANQIIAKGQWRSFLAYGKEETGFGLYDGKLYLMAVNTTSGTVGNRTPHPLNPDVGGTKYAILGNKNIADGNWHHVIVQLGYSDDRIQFWIDGQLDKQIITGASQYSRLYIMGSNNANTNYQSDFETSGWSYDKQGFIEERDVTLNSAAYVKYEPIKAEVAKATLTMTANNSATGNRGRALMLYWWPEDSTINPGAFSGSRPQEGGVTFDPGLSTDDFLRRPPQEYYGWDVYPVDITGRYVSELVKKEAYGEENIITRSIPTTITGQQRTPANTEYLTNANGHFVDPITDARRYIDLVKDIDLTQFDTIFFKNYPEQSTERDSYTREEFADEYFNLREKTLFDNFIKSLRAALDTGISLYITNADLAVDLGIIDRYEDVSIMHEGDFQTGATLGDQYLNAIFGTTNAIQRRDDGWYPDLHKNNRFRIVNTYPELTDDPYYIWTDWAFFANDAALDFGGSDRPYARTEYKPNGLQVGDTFLISTPILYDRSPFQAVPFANIKSGKVITAFANTVLSAGTAIENPYKNHATTIILEPGDKVMGEPIASKIFINFTERLYFPYSKTLGISKENQLIELIQDEHINRAYQEGFITLEKRNEYLAAEYNLDRQLEAAIAAGNQNLINVINAKKYWTLNGDNLIISKQAFGDGTGVSSIDVSNDIIGKARVNRINKKGALSTRVVYSELPWFTIEAAWQYPTIMTNTPSMLTRGFRWLSNRNEDIGTVLRVDPMTAIATGLPMPVVVGDKDRTINAIHMFANARFVSAAGYSPANFETIPLPMYANAKMGEFVKNIKPDVFTATATFRQNVRTVGIQEDEIVVYIHHVDPIVYLREEVIK